MTEFTKMAPGFFETGVQDPADPDAEAPATKDGMGRSQALQALREKRTEIMGDRDLPEEVRKDRLLDKLRQSRRNWSCGDLTTILKGTGFEWRDSKHRVFRHPEFTDLGSYPIPRDKELAPDYAKHVLRCVEEALARYKAREESEK